MTEPTSPTETPADPRAAGLARLREPFPPEHIGFLPRITCRDCSDSRQKVCDRHSKSKCEGCGNWITGAHIHLDYVGHAAATDRLLEVDPEWNWEPVATDEQGRPVFELDRGSPVGLWIKLTVLDVTRLGYGSVEHGKFDPEKQLIGDALRNAAMRFGVALDLWIKGHDEEDDRAAPAPKAPAAPPPDPKLAGWASKDEAVAAHTPLRDAMAALPDEAKSRLTAWRTENGLTGWPLPKAAFDDVAAQVEALVLAADFGMLDPDAVGATASAERSETPPSAAEPPTEPQGTTRDAYDLPPLDKPGPDDCPDCGCPIAGHKGKGCADCFCTRKFVTSANTDSSTTDEATTGHCFSCGGAIYRDDVGLWNHADEEDEAVCIVNEPSPAGPTVDVDALYAAVRAPKAAEGTAGPEESIEAQVAAMTPTEVMVQLGAADLPLSGTQKVRRQRLLEHRQASGVCERVEVTPRTRKDTQ